MVCSWRLHITWPHARWPCCDATQPLSHLLRSKKTLSLCIHLRTGDKYINSPGGAFCSSESSFLSSQHAFMCAQQLEDRLLEVRPVLLTTCIIGLPASHAFHAEFVLHHV
jgi:hypothetical protein